jgi:hypothetical protein
MDEKAARLREQAEHYRMLACLVTDDALAARLRRTGETLLERALRPRAASERRRRGLLVAAAQPRRRDGPGIDAPSRVP